MKNQINLGRYFGIEVGLHFSWFISAFLIEMSVAQDFQSRNPDWSPRTVWATALASGILFFITIVIHELGHSLVAKAHGFQVKRITLFALGGVSQIENESESAWTEFWISIAGPLASFAIGGFCLALAHTQGWTSGTPHTPWLALLVWLGFINLGLALFNLLPGFPLDGSRILRALIWFVTKNGDRATRLGARIGHQIAMGMIFIGVFRFFRGAEYSGLWLAFIGWFLNQAAQATWLKAEWEAALKGLRVEDILLRDTPVVESTTDLETFVNDSLLPSGQNSFVVREHDRNVGLVSAQDVRQIDKTEWSLTPVRRVMQRFDRLPTIPAGVSAEAALAKLDQEQVNQLAVVTNGQIDGIVSRATILQQLHSHMARDK